MYSISPEELEIKTLHSYLLSSVAPRPIAWASTIDKNGLPNLAPFSFFNVFSANPPILIFSPARRVRDNSKKHTLKNVIETHEVVINVVNYPLVHACSLSSTEYPDGINEFEKSGVSMLKSDVVKPYRIKESPIQLECKVNDIIALGKNNGAGNLVICEVVKLHLSYQILDNKNQIIQEKLDLVSRAGGSYYNRAKNGFFEIPKPISTMGIGVDKIPKIIKENFKLSFNEWAQIGNIAAFPTEKEIDLYNKLKENKSNSSIEDISVKISELIQNGNPEKALLEMITFKI